MSFDAVIQILAIYNDIVIVAQNISIQKYQNF